MGLILEDPLVDPLRSQIAASSIRHRDAIKEWLENRPFNELKSSLHSEVTEPNRPTFSIVLSHRQRRPERFLELRRGVEEILKDGFQRGAKLVVSPETPFGPYLIQAAKRLGVVVQCILTPTCDQPSSESIPWIDRALVSMPDRVYVLDIQVKSKTYDLICRRLKDDRFPKGSVFLDAERSSGAGHLNSRQEDAQLTAARASLIDCGAVLRIRYQTDSGLMQIQGIESNGRNSVLVPSAFMIQLVAPILHKLPRVHSSSTANGGYLTHCTRACVGPWPDQSEVGYFDGLIAMQDAQASPLDTLVRILRQQRILASNHLKRGQHSSVSFSAVPLLELLSRRKFRPHLGRWDWEPYGICIQIQVIEQLNGRPVRYGPADLWDQLDAEDQPFFQPLARNASRFVGEDEQASWAEEREWRLLDDLHLATIPPTKAFVFVPTMVEAVQIQRLSRFPILCIERLLR